MDKSLKTLQHSPWTVPWNTNFFSIFRIILLETGMEDTMEYSCAVLQVLKVHFSYISMMLFQVCF